MEKANTYTHKKKERNNVRNKNTFFLNAVHHWGGEGLTVNLSSSATITEKSHSRMLEKKNIQATTTKNYIARKKHIRRW